MDSQQFDRFTRVLASGATRRDVLKGMLAGAVGGMFGRSRGAGAQPSMVNVCHRTDDPANPVVLIAVPVSAVPAHEAHGDAIDPDFSSDEANCGDCGAICPTPENGTAVCSGGVCDIVCDSDYVPDGAGRCVCGLTCDGNFRLDREACACFCPVEEIVCDPGYVVNPGSCTCECGPDDVSNCCGIVCPTPANATATCAGGECGFVCNDGYESDGAGGCVLIPICRELFETCNSADECCDFDAGLTGCAQLAGSCATGTTKLCCHTFGGQCDLDCSCCPPFVCGGGGRCVDPL